jgi:hypothetical protein
MELTSNTNRAVLLILLVLIVAQAVDPSMRSALQELVPFLFLIGFLAVQRDFQQLAAKVLSSSQAPGSEHEKQATTATWLRDLVSVLFAVSLGVAFGFLVMEWGLQ